MATGKVTGDKPIPGTTRKIELYTPNYFAACTLGGIIGM
jgi:hypothetical protein